MDLSIGLETVEMAVVTKTDDREEHPFPVPTLSPLTPINEDLLELVEELGIVIEEPDVEPRPEVSIDEVGSVAYGDYEDLNERPAVVFLSSERWIGWAPVREGYQRRPYQRVSLPETNSFQLREEHVRTPALHVHPLSPFRPPPVSRPETAPAPVPVAQPQEPLPSTSTAGLGTTVFSAPPPAPRSPTSSTSGSSSPEPLWTRSEMRVLDRCLSIPAQRSLTTMLPARDSPTYNIEDDPDMRVVSPTYPPNYVYAPTPEFVSSTDDQLVPSYIDDDQAVPDVPVEPNEDDQMNSTGSGRFTLQAGVDEQHHINLTTRFSLADYRQRVISEVMTAVRARMQEEREREVSSDED